MSDPVEKLGVQEDNQILNERIHLNSQYLNLETQLNSQFVNLESHLNSQLLNLETHFNSQFLNLETHQPVSSEHPKQDMKAGLTCRDEGSF